MATHSHVIRIKAPKDRVFDALSTTDGLKGWYTPHVDGEVAPGKTMTLRFTGREPFRWKIVELQPGVRAEWECVEGPGAARGTSVAFKLSDASEGRTEIACEHNGLDEGHDAFNSCNTRWGILLGRLRDFAETSNPHPAFH